MSGRTVLALLASATGGMTLLGSYALSQPNPEAAYLATESITFVATLVFFVAAFLWLILDAREHTDIDIDEMFSNDRD